MDAITDGFVQMNDDAVPAFLGYWGPRWAFPYTGPTDTFLRVREPPLTYETDLDDFYF